MEAPIYRPSGGTPSKGKITTGDYNDVIMSAMASHIGSLTIVYSIVYSSADQRIHQSFASLPSVWGIHRWPVHFPHKGPVTRNIFPFDDVIMGFTSRSTSKAENFSISWRHHGSQYYWLVLLRTSLFWHDMWPYCQCEWCHQYVSHIC